MIEQYLKNPYFTVELTFFKQRACMYVLGLGYIFLAAYGRKRDGHILWNSRVPLSGNGLTPKTGSPSRLYRIVVVTLIVLPRPSGIRIRQGSRLVVAG